MARIRTVKPEFTQDEDLSALPAETHLLAVGLLCYSDDFGYFNANPGLVKAAIFPVRETSATVTAMLSDLERIGFIQTADGSDGKRYGRVVKFNEHQRVSHPSPSKIKTLVADWNTSGSLRNDSGILPKNSGTFPNDSALKGKEWNGREEERNGTEARESVVVGEVIHETSIPKPDEFADLPAEAVARGLWDQLGYSGLAWLRLLTDCVLKAAQAWQLPPVRAGDRIVAELKAYREDPAIEYRVGDKRFFEDGMYLNRDKWKRGRDGNTGKTGSKFAAVSAAISGANATPIC